LTERTTLQANNRFVITAGWPRCVLVLSHALSRCAGATTLLLSEQQPSLRQASACCHVLPSLSC
jgi:hypothetical protein